MKLKRISQALLTPVLLSGIVFAPQADAADADALAKAVQNPLASMVTLPLQANYNGGIGPLSMTPGSSTFSRKDCKAGRFNVLPTDPVCTKATVL